MHAPAAVTADRGAPLAPVEFIALVASLMAMVALGIDTMLPALPAIGRALDVSDANNRQFVITVFGAGFGVAHLIHGPVTDRFGRRRVLIVSLVAYIAMNILAAIARDFTLLLVTRFLGGAAVAATRVATIAMVRDCYSGRAMARVMSLTFMVFMAIPVIAPALGAAILLFGDWRTIFWIIAGAALAVLGWIVRRLPETLDPADRRAIEIAPILAGWRQTLRDRQSIGYTLAGAALTAALYGYLGSIEQVMADTFGRPRLLVVIFATSAGLMAVANLMNARAVMRLGTRRLSHGAVAAMIVTSGLHLAIGLSGHETLLVFAVLQALTMAGFALASANFGAMAMEHMGHIAGTASSVQGFLAITFGALGGMVIGQAFDGTTAPLTAGFLAAALFALAMSAVVERGRLFRPA